MKEKLKIQRMLKWFEAQLPEHEVGKWFFEIKPHKVLVVDETDVMRIGSSMGIGVLTGYGSCVRCGQRFDLEYCGNYTVYAESEQERLAREFPTLPTEARILQAKADLQSAAERSGKCWGDVPRIERSDSMYFQPDNYISP